MKRGQLQLIPLLLPIALPVIGYLALGLGGLGIINGATKGLFGYDLTGSILSGFVRPIAIVFALFILFKLISLLASAAGGQELNPYATIFLVMLTAGLFTFGLIGGFGFSTTDPDAAKVASLAALDASVFVQALLGTIGGGLALYGLQKHVLGD